MKTLLLKNLSDVPTAATSIIEFAGGKKVFCFYGDLGAGKTTLIKEICKQLGVIDLASSPTFSIVNEYLRRDAPSVYHFDLYRLKSESEVFDLGYEDYLFSDKYCFIEWPEKILHLLPPNIIHVRITSSNSERIITVE